MARDHLSASHSCHQSAILTPRPVEEALTGVTGSPVFIVGMVLLVTVIGIVTVLGLYFRYQKK